MTQYQNEKKNSGDFTTSLLVDQSPRDVFDAVTNVRGWWSGTIKGKTEALNDVFTYEVKDVHWAKFELTEVIPGKRVVWHVLDSRLSFVENEKEWNDTNVTFDISRQGDKTRLVFTHQGLVPELECYDVCYPAWTEYVQDSLYKLIIGGKGDPNLEGRLIKTPAVK